MADLRPEDFATYFEEIHGHPPFPWQDRLLAQVARDGFWPSLLDLPTGTGKTAAIDVALFHLALDAARAPADRTAPRRILMVVDRRTVVDQAFERATKIALALRSPSHEVLRTVADRLRELSGGDSKDAPFALAQLRGGMPRDDAWAHRPDQPLVGVSTVDQVGSRLLFRGYGVSPGMRPIHAGLLGNDALILLDEVHLSSPFLATLEAVRRYRGWMGKNLPSRWQAVAMSATPGSEKPSVVPFGLADDDRADPRLARRLIASKPIELEEVKVSGGDDAKRATFAKACAAHAVAFTQRGRAVGVVVNRVATARETFDAVRQRLGDNAIVFLVTGRMRPLDRDDLDKKLVQLVRSGRTRGDAPPIVVVSTQCIEAGADFDFDALVTECASLDALRQRFGRLNRLGEIDDARGVILVRSDALKKDEVDPIYGRSLAATWQWLSTATKNFGIHMMDSTLPAAEELAELLSPKARAPVMLPAHLDAWAQTKPAPRPDPDVSLWLHGVDQKQAPEVQIVWRADLTEAMFAEARHSDEKRAMAGTVALLARIEACAPVGLEAMSLPIYTVQAWLAHQAPQDLADVEGRSTATTHEYDDGGSRLVLAWQGDDGEVIEARDLRPGMIVVVPSTYGGIADGAWAPSSVEPVPDLGDRARWQQTRRPTLRMYPGAFDASWPPVLSVDSESPDVDDRARMNEWLDRAPSLDGISWLTEVVSALKNRRRKRPALIRLEAIEGDNGEPIAPGYFTLAGRARETPGLDVAGDIGTEDDGASYIGQEVTLHAHMKGVADWAARFAERCGLPVDLAHDIVLAARWHDAGKADSRFQMNLLGGSAFRMETATEPLAKSAIVFADREARRRASERSGYPRGGRHELSSVRLMESHPSLLSAAHDHDLVLHLVASHHGWCRPFAPVTVDPDPVDIELHMDGALVRVTSGHELARLDSGVAERFWRLVECYGWFGLAWLEAILRLADHRRSEEEQRGVDTTEAGQ